MSLPTIEIYPNEEGYELKLQTDLEEYDRLYKDCVVYNVSYWNAALRKAIVTFIARRDGHCCGIGTLETVPQRDTLSLAWLCAHRAGRAMINAMVDFCQWRGVKYLMVTPTQSAEAFYRKVGFAGHGNMIYSVPQPPYPYDLRSGSPPASESIQLIKLHPDVTRTQLVDAIEAANQALQVYEENKDSRNIKKAHKYLQYAERIGRNA
jgi:hypothetical protein